MKIQIEQGSVVIFAHGTPQEETYQAGQSFDVDEAIGLALVAGGSARSLIEYRPDALTQ